MDEICKVKNCQKLCSYDDYCSYHYLMVRSQELQDQYQEDLDDILALSDEALANLDIYTSDLEDDSHLSSDDIKDLLSKDR